MLRVSASPLMALLNSHLCRRSPCALCRMRCITSMRYQTHLSTDKGCRLHHGKHLPKLLQRLTPLFSGPKLSFQATATSLPSQINALYADSHILKINLGHERSSSSPVQWTCFGFHYPAKLKESNQFQNDCVGNFLCTRGHMERRQMEKMW